MSIGVQQPDALAATIRAFLLAAQRRCMERATGYP
jgi:hypothetical protein